MGKLTLEEKKRKVKKKKVEEKEEPTKLQVRFKNTEFVYKAVFEAVSHALKETYLVPDVSLTERRNEFKPDPVVEQVAVETFFAPRIEDNHVSSESLLNRKIESLTGSATQSYTIDRLFGSNTTYHNSIQEPNPEIQYTPPEKEQRITSIEDVPFPSKVHVEPKSTTPAILPSEYRIVGQLFKTYWLIQYYEKVFIIDQHAAHERVLYEQFMAQFRANKVTSQILLMPETLNITPIEMELLTKYNTVFDTLGFKYEVFGDNAIVIREVPFILNEPLSPSIFREVLDRLTHDKIEDIAHLKVESIIRLSCRSAIKAHDHISDEECHKLIEDLLALDNPFTCPHGRPTLVALTQLDIEKMFKRV